MLRKLADNGQAILCTIHQPSAILFQQFDRLLLLAKGGRTLYFGDIGESAKTFTSYFERNGARPCGQDENPAEWMLDITGAAPGSHSEQDWPAIWNDSEERRLVKAELAHMEEKLSQKPLALNGYDATRQFAVPLTTQLSVVLARLFQQYWRSPSYLYSKVALCLFSVSQIDLQNNGQPTNLFTGTFYRFFVLENTKFPPRIAKPALCHLHAVDDLFKLLHPNHAPFRRPEITLRSPGTTIQNLFLENIHLIQHPRRDPMEFAHGCTRLCELVLSNRASSKCSGCKPSF